MARFDDYHRTVIGYHGTTLSVALQLVTRVSTFTQSERDYDWLGKGVYFWEYAPQQALNFAKIRQRQLQEKQNKTLKEELRAEEPVAVVACMIRLGNCLDLTEPANIGYMKDIYTDYKQNKLLGGQELPKNTRKYRRLDREVFDYAYSVLENTEGKQKVDTSRGVFVSKDGGKRIWDGSWISTDTHIQLCVRNQNNILGTWLNEPSSLEVNNVCNTLQAVAAAIHPANPQG